LYFITFQKAAKDGWLFPPNFIKVLDSEPDEV